jgi:RNA polymerase sigma factor (TIGR02999 family)
MPVTSPPLEADPQAIAEVTALLQELAQAQPCTLPALFALVQGDLRQVAHRERLASRAGDTLSTTALINEAYIKLDRGNLTALGDRRHFFAVAARAMRQVLVDYARARLAQKRGGGVAMDTLEHHDAAFDPSEVLELDDALDRLDAQHPRLAQVVHLRFYAGLGDRDIGSLLDVDESTVRRDWLKARGWLYAQLHPDVPPT